MLAPFQVFIASYPVGKTTLSVVRYGSPIIVCHTYPSSEVDIFSLYQVVNDLSLLSFAEGAGVEPALTV